MDNVYIILVKMNFGFSEITLLNSAWKIRRDAERERHKVVDSYRSDKKVEALRLLGNPIVTVLIQTLPLQ